MAQFDHQNQFIKSGLQRIQDAEELMQPPTLLPKMVDAKTRHLNGAVYFAGYGVECFLKAYIINEEVKRGSDPFLSAAQEAINQRQKRAGDAPIRDIGRGGSGHDLNYLLYLTRLEDTWDITRSQQFGICSSWRSEWRYNPQPVSLIYATGFVIAARKLVNWLAGQI